MRILFQNRRDTRERPGGDSVVFDAMAAFLREAGHSVSTSFAPEPCLDEIDVVHLFNLTRPHECAAQARHARRQGKPYLLTPIYWDLIGGIPWHAFEWPRRWRIRMTPRGLREARPGTRMGNEFEAQAETLRHARWVLPSSQAEADHLAQRFPKAFDADRCLVLPHGADVPDPSPNPVIADAGSILCAGAIGPRKNQLGLCRALRGTKDLRLSLIGDPGVGCEGYARAVRRSMHPTWAMESAITRTQLLERVREFRAVAQPSYIETPGLVALEARCLGRPVVVSDTPPVREVFGRDDLVFYCDPSSEESIRRACEAAIAAEPDDGLRFASACKWSIVLRPLMTAYDQIAPATGSGQA